jgi:hypothetical protein
MRKSFFATSIPASSFASRIIASKTDSPLSTWPATMPYFPSSQPVLCRRDKSTVRFLKSIK